MLALYIKMKKTTIILYKMCKQFSAPEKTSMFLYWMIIDKIERA